MNLQIPKTKLTIGMPVFNDIDFIKDSINSILNQQDEDFILIISDDNSTDGSGEICNSIAQQDSRVIYIKQPVNIGISKNMKLLLELANSPYFMWAGDDDLWHPNFTKILINLLEQTPQAICAFCIYQEINDIGGNYYPHPTDVNYQNISKVKRIKKLIVSEDDGFGYGIFKTELIKEVEFPIWWWPNKKSPLNNIFPTLCYYLSIGDFAYYDKEILFWKRKKSRKKMNYTYTAEGAPLKAFIAYFIRKFNLVVISFKSINKTSGFFTAFRILPTLLIHWLIIPFLKQIRISLRAMLKQGK
jgi:glycosyltransferase involved in cell wall biosynthesis